jgi:hypothetical protein
MHRKFVCKLFTQPFHWAFGFQPFSDGQIKRMHQMNVYWLLQHVTSASSKQRACTSQQLNQAPASTASSTRQSLRRQAN